MPAFLRERFQWERQRDERDLQKIRSRMMGYGGVGLLLMAVAVFAFFRMHALIALEDPSQVLYQFLGLFCSFLGTQSFFVGFLYAFVLKFQYDGYKSLLRPTAEAFSYVFAILSVTVFLQKSYLAAGIGYLLIYPALCYLTYKRF
jgi:hypothetical protein